MMYGFSAGMKSTPLVLVRDPLDDTKKEKLVTTIENPEKPGELIWVEYTGVVTEEDRRQRKISGNEEEIDEAREAIRRKLSTGGTKTDNWMCAICGQADDHWPPTCPNKDDNSFSSLRAKRNWEEFQARGSKAKQPKNSFDEDLDALAQASRGCHGNIYTHWQCRICGKIDDHWPRMCPFRYLSPGFVAYTDRVSSTGTGKSSVSLYGSMNMIHLGDAALFCGICGARDHVPAYCTCKGNVKLFTDTPPPVKTIHVHRSSPKRKISWSTDFLVLPDPVRIPEYQPELMPRDEDDDFFASPEEMIDYIREVNKKSKATGSMADKPVVVGGAWTPPPRPLEYCRYCCKKVKHSYIRCPDLHVRPACNSCGKRNCYKHLKINSAPLIPLPGRSRPFKTSEDAPRSAVKGFIYNPRKRCYQEIVEEVSDPFPGVVFKPGERYHEIVEEVCGPLPGVIFKPGESYHEIVEEVSVPEKRLQKPLLDQIEAVQQDKISSNFLII